MALPYLPFIREEANQHQNRYYSFSACWSLVKALYSGVSGLTPISSRSQGHFQMGAASDKISFCLLHKSQLFHLILCLRFPKDNLWIHFLLADNLTYSEAIKVCCGNFALPYSHGFSLMKHIYKKVCPWDSWVIIQFRAKNTISFLCRTQWTT